MEEHLTTPNTNPNYFDAARDIIPEEDRNPNKDYYPEFKDMFIKNLVLKKQLSDVENELMPL
jgi:hypothetical protein